MRPLEYDGRTADAAQLLASFVARDDNAEDWVDLARLTLQTTEDGDRSAADSAANGGERLCAPPTMASPRRRSCGWPRPTSRLDRGRDELAALRLAEPADPG